jgi:hypothetical protein
MKLEGRSQAEIQRMEVMPIRLTPADTQAAPDLGFRPETVILLCHSLEAMVITLGRRVREEER